MSCGPFAILWCGLIARFPQWSQTCSFFLLNNGREGPVRSVLEISQHALLCVMRVRAPEKQLWAARSEFSLAARNLARQAKKGYKLAAEDQECFLGVP